MTPDFGACLLAGVAAMLLFIWLFSLGGTVVRLGMFPAPDLELPVVIWSSVLSAISLLAFDALSGFFSLFVYVQLASGIVGFCLGVAIFRVFPKIKTPTGKVLDVFLKIISSMTFPP